MKKIDSLQTNVPETVTISRAEYEELQAQSKRVSELESRVDMLMEALRLAQHKRFGASSEKSEDALYEQAQKVRKLYNPYRNLYLDKYYGESKRPLGEWMDFSKYKE